MAIPHASRSVAHSSGFASVMSLGDNKKRIISNADYTRKEIITVLWALHVDETGKVLYVSPSSTIWYQPMGGDALRLVK